MEKMYNIKEAAELLHITTGWLKTMNIKRVIPYYKPSPKVCLYKESDLEAYINRTRISSSEELDAKARLY